MGWPGPWTERTWEMRVPLSLSPVQVNLLRKMWVTGVVTQGASRVGSAEYLRTFKVAYSLDGHKFQFIQDAEGLRDKVGPVGALKKGCG